MVAIALILALLLVAAAAAYLIHRERQVATTRIREAERLARMHDARVDSLLDRLNLAYEKPLYNTPPIDETPPAAEDDDADDDQLFFDASQFEEMEAYSGSGGTF